MKFRIACLLWISSFYVCIGQNVGVPLGNPTYDILERLEIKTGVPAPYHSELKYYARRDVATYALEIDSAQTDLSQLDQADLNYIFRDNNEFMRPATWPTTLTGPNESAYQKVYVDSSRTFYTYKYDDPNIASQNSQYYVMNERPIFGFLYKTPANLFEIDVPYFYMKLNPIINFRMANERDDSELIFYNQRGVEVRAGIDDRIFFYSRILETQARFPDYVDDFLGQYGALPGAGLVKAYKSSIFDITNGRDFLTAQGYVGFNVSKHVGMQFGHGRNFIGDGYRSMLLSDFANNYLYLKLNTRVWKLHYQNIFAELNATSNAFTRGDNLLPKKYLAAHYLSFRPTPKLSLGFYEGIIFNRKEQFELQYLNPVIFYRTVEQGLDSPDNIMIGLTARWDILNRFRLYGQLLMDEFKFDELFIERRGWWANKFGLQIGVKAVDLFGIDHLNARVELNKARPYTYVHRDSFSNFHHQNQALAHPFGANFEEALFTLSYQPIHKLKIDGRLILATKGLDEPRANWGGNILLSYDSREQDFNNETTQGITTDYRLLGVDVSYQLYHNFFLELYYFNRLQENILDTQRTTYFGGGVRWNIHNRRMDF